MRRRQPIRLLFALLATFATAAVSAQTGDTDQMIRDAVSHHDQQEFALAVELLERVLELEPDNGMAFYELAFTHQVSGDLEACAEVAETGLRRIDPAKDQAQLVPGLYMLQGSCHSSGGDTAEALRVFRQGLNAYPDDYGLNFNIAVTLSNAGQLDDAIGYYSRALRADPFHPSPYYTIGGVYHSQGQSIPAVLALLNFLQREYNTERSTIAARTVFDIALSHVNAEESGDQTRIYVDPGDNGGSPDAMALSLALSVSVLAHVSEGRLKEPVADSLAGILSSFIDVAANLEPGSDDDTIFSIYLLPGVGRVAEEGVTEAFSRYVAVTAGVEGSGQWLDEHPDAVDALVAYMNMLEEERYGEPF